MDNWKYCNHFVLRSTGFPFEIFDRLALKETCSYIKESVDQKSDLLCDKTLKLLFEKELGLLFEAMINILHEFPRIKEAIFYSNNAFFYCLDKIHYNGIHSLNYRTRLRAKTLYMFLQRFAAKNDTIDFYGPTSYGTFEDNKDNNIKLIWKSPANRLISSNFFTNRAIQTIGGTIANHPEARGQMVPVINRSLVSKNNTAIICSISRQLENPADELIFKKKILTDADVKILSLAYKKKTTSEITDILINEDALSAKQVWENFDALIQAGLITFELPVPKHATFLLPYLRQSISQLKDGDYKQSIVNQLSHLKKLRDQYYTEPEYSKKQTIFDDLAKQFLELTNNDAWISTGKFYEERFICYRDTQKAVETFYIGNKLKEDFEKNVPLVLDLLMAVPNMFYARSSELLTRYTHLYYQDGERDNLVIFLEKLHKNESYLKEIQAMESKFTDWSHLLYTKIIDTADNIVFAADDNSHIERIELTRENILEILNEYPYKPEHAYVAPDFLIAAASVEDVCRGNYQIIIGELHTNIRVLLMAPSFCNYHKKEKLLADFQKCVDRLNENSFVADVIREDSGRSLRSGDTIMHDILYTGFSQKEEQKQILFSELEIIVNPDRVDLIDKHGNKIKFAFVVPTFFESNFLRAFSYPMWFGPAPYLRSANQVYYPEVRYGNIIISRSTWHLTAETFTNLFTDKKQARPFDDFITLHRYFHTMSYPFQFYAKFQSEPKVIYFDIENYFSVELFKNLIMKKGNKKFMLVKPMPDGNSLWLADESGHYCNELRTLYYY